MLTAERLRSIVDYDESTGLFVWKVDVGVVKAGQIAGARKADGYHYIGIGGKRYLAHRLAWLYVYGAWPVREIDHINGTRHDNRICNLRDVTRSVNARNLHRAYKNNASKTLGVTWFKQRGKWRADKHGKYLGSFDTIDAAKAAWDAA